MLTTIRDATTTPLTTNWHYSPPFPIYPHNTRTYPLNTHISIHIGENSVSVHSFFIAVTNWLNDSPSYSEHLFPLPSLWVYIIRCARRWPVIYCIVSNIVFVLDFLLPHISCESKQLLCNADNWLCSHSKYQHSIPLQPPSLRLWVLSFLHS